MADFEKISVTAKLAAYMRQFSDIPFAQNVAEYLRADAAFDAMLRVTGLSPEQFTWYAPIFEVRYKSIGEVLRKSGIRQVIELASGLSLRGLAMTRDPSVTYVDTDMAGIAEEKIALVASIERGSRFSHAGNYRIRVADATDRSEISAAVEGLDPTRSIAIVNEGLLMYLSPAEVRAVTDNVRHVLKRFGGIWITPDFSLQSESGRVSEQQQMVRQAVAGVIDRGLYESAFADEAELQMFFDEMGFQAEVRYQVDEAPNVVSIARLNLPDDTLERLRPKLKLRVLQLTAVP